MATEFEATFTNINKSALRKILQGAGATLIREEFLQKRLVFNLPRGHETEGGWLRIRDEGDKITMSLKVIDGKKIENQREIYLKVSDFDQAVLLLTTIGCQQKAFQESKRELWKLGEVEITLDEWPFLEPFCEVEGPSELAVKKAADKIGFDYQKALFCSGATLYSKKYGIPETVINNQTPLITFSGKNPFR